MGIFFVISGPSGVGKSTIIDAILKDAKFIDILSQKGFTIKKLVSYTTRKPRKGEKNGIHYNFISIKDFENMIKNNEFLEWAKVYDNYYGTSLKQLQDKHNTIFIKDLDTKGALNVKNILKNQAVLIFIMPPSFAELEKRIIQRGKDPSHTIKQRLKEAKNEIEKSKHYDYTIVNDILSDTVKKIENIIISKIEF